jgi:capsule polysaccharide export protein KpsE/RkpR
MNSAGSAPVRQPLTAPDEESPRVLTSPEGLQDDESALARLQLIWNHRRLLSRVGLYGLIFSSVIAVLIPARYTSIARLMPPDNQPSVGLALAAATTMTGSAGGLGEMATNLLGLKSTSDVFVGVLNSRTVADKLIEQFDLKRVYRDRRMEDARIDLADHTSISVDRKSQIISIAVTDKSPQRAAAMAQAYVAELNKLVADLSTSSARRERIFLEGRLQSVSKDLEAAERDFSQFASNNTAIDVKEQGKAMVEAAALLQGQLIAAQSQYEGIREIYTDSSPKVRTIKARIDELERQLEKLGGKTDNDTTNGKPAQESMYPSIRKLPLLGVTYADLYRRTKIQEVVLETLTKEYEMAKVQEVKEIPTVKTLDVGHIPDKKSFPPRLLFMALGTALALAAATSWIFAKTAWDHTDSTDQRKVFAQEVFLTFAARVRAFPRNGNSDRSVNGGAWSRVGTPKLNRSSVEKLD